MAKFRYRSGNQWNCGGVTVRTPCGAVGHGGHYHSQSPEAYLAHTPGLVVVMPRSPRTAKGLLLSSIRSKDPVIFMEPKVSAISEHSNFCQSKICWSRCMNNSNFISLLSLSFHLYIQYKNSIQALYRAAVEDVPDDDYMIPLGKAEIMRSGTDCTVVGWGGQLRVLEKACDMALADHGISCELIDLRTILPWDADCVLESVAKTGKLVVSHEAPITCGFGAEVVATVQEQSFLSLEAPIQRVCGYDTPFPLVFEKYYVPDELKNLEAIKRVMDYAK